MYFFGKLKKNMIRNVSRKPDTKTSITATFIRENKSERKIRLTTV